jgi:hypothetical protein
LPVGPINRLHEFVQKASKADARSLPLIFREFPELRMYLVIPYFDSLDLERVNRSDSGKSPIEGS